MSTATNSAATTTSSKAPKSENSISKADLAKMFEGPIDFDNAQGESFVGLNLLTLQINEADGPFVVVGTEDKEFKTGKRVDMRKVFHCTKGSTPIDMPVSASFLKKAEEARLAVGDTFLVKRSADYDSKENGTKNCKSYLIKVVGRAGK